MELNKYSKQVTQDPTLPAAQAMLHAIGLSNEDLKKPQVGIASLGYDGNPCNMHLNLLANDVKHYINNKELVGLVFNTIGVSDGISMGTFGMRYSLPSRDVIADSMETVMNAQNYDGLVAVVGCDKNMPGAMMAIGRLNRPAIVLYGGTIRSGEFKGRQLNIVSAFEALGEKNAGTLSEEDYQGVIEHACPGAGACGGMYTANTMSSAIEAMGMSLPYSASNPAVSNDKKTESEKVAEAFKHLLELDLKPKDIVTKASFENAIRLIIVLGGSTNAVMHLMAMAKAFDVDLSLDDFTRLNETTPLLGDLKPSGKYLMEDLHNVGGVPAVMKLMLENDLLDGSCMSVTGKTIAENLADIPTIGDEQDVVRTLDNPIKKDGHLRILFGNLAEEGAVAKITGKEGERFEGEAVVYDSEFDANDGILNNEVKAGNVVVIRYEGPKGGPGMPEMLKPTSLIMGKGIGKEVALITDGRFSGGSHGFVVGHVSPEAQNGGNIALIENGDTIVIDARSNTIELKVSEEEIEKRRAAWKQPPLRVQKGILYKYAKSVSSASKGCVTDE